jgi:hypothetical protein
VNRSTAFGRLNRLATSLAKAFLRNYPEGQWISRKRDRLTSSINRAAGEGAGNEGISK